LLVLLLVLLLGISWGREGIDHSPRRASIFMVVWFVKRVMAGGREVSWIGVGEESQDARQLNIVWASA
jgi:hypothetical protein